MITENIFSLLTYITEHGFDACFTNGKLMALNVYTEKKEGQIVVAQCWEEIEPNLTAVRAWLGY